MPSREAGANLNRRGFIKLAGGATVVLASGAAVVPVITANVNGVSVQSEILRLAMRWFVKCNTTKLDTATIRKRLEYLTRIFPRQASDTKAAWFNANGVAALRVTRPESRDKHHVFYLHGGGYIAGSVLHYRDFLWRIATATRSHVLCVAYRLAPEHPFPAATDDAMTAYRWLLAADIDPRNIVMMGDSAGGGLVLATLLRLRDEGIALPAAAVLLSPWTDLAMSGNSFNSNARSDPMLRPEAVRYAAETYLAGSDPRNPYASPLYGDPTGLPRSLIQVGSDEIQLDDSVRMADKMRAAGCHVDLQIWPRMPHAWHLFASYLPESKRAIEQIGAFVLR